jgi:hypothetical protein
MPYAKNVDLISTLEVTYIHAQSCMLTVDIMMKSINTVTVVSVSGYSWSIIK